MAGQRQCHQRRGQHRIGHPHHRQQVAVTDAIADHPEDRGNQRAGVVERRNQGQQQHRSGLGQHIPAENERLHLEGPGGEQVGGPLEAVIPDAKGRQRRKPRDLAQRSMPRFIASHPARIVIPGDGFHRSRHCF